MSPAEGAHDTSPILPTEPDSKASSDHSDPAQTERPIYPRINTSIVSPNEGGRPSRSPSDSDRVFPVRSVISVDPNSTPIQRPHGEYFPVYARASDARIPRDGRSHRSTAPTSPPLQAAIPSAFQDTASETSPQSPAQAPSAEGTRLDIRVPWSGAAKAAPPRIPAHIFNEIISSRPDDGSGTAEPSESGTGRLALLGGASSRDPSIRSQQSSTAEYGGLVAHRFKHVMTSEGHAIITGRDGEALQRCEDEPIHIPGAIQGFGLLIALQEDQSNGNLMVRIVSENSNALIRRTPQELFALESFTDILSEEQADNILDHIDFIRDEGTDVAANGPQVFTMSIKIPGEKSRKFWCAMHINDTNPHLIICEFEMEDDPVNPLISPLDITPEIPEDTLNSDPTPEEYAESTEIKSRPLRVLRSARKRKGEAAAMEVFNIMSQVQDQLASAPNLEKFLQVLVGVVKELTGFHRVMIYQFDQAFNGRVVTELVDPRATKDLYKGLSFPASDIPKQARDLYKLNGVRILYDRDQQTARLVCRSAEDLETPLDLSYSYLRAMSPIHLKYLKNMAVRSSMSIAINAFGELWGLIACHSYGRRGMRVSFPIRKMARLIGDSASRNIERLSYASRLQARKLINTVPTQHKPSGYIIASSDDLLKLFDADFGLLSIRDETKILGTLEHSQEALAMLEYLRMRRITSVMTSQDVTQDFPDLRYPPGFQVIAGMLIVPLSTGGNDFIVFFRKGQLKEVKWAGNPYEKFVREGTEGYLEPRTSFRTWRETVIGKSKDWTEEEIETAAVLCLVYGKFIEVWRQKEAALQNSELTRLLLANSAHEVRTPLNAIINYLEIALEGTLDQDTRENLAKSHSASKSLIYVINDLLDLTKTEEGEALIKGEEFDLPGALHEATDMFRGDAKRKGLVYEIIEHPGLPQKVIGDQRRVRQAISNITANAIQHTSSGMVKVEMYVSRFPSREKVEIEVACTDTGVGMSAQKLDELFNALEQVQTGPAPLLDDASTATVAMSDDGKDGKGPLGLGLAVVSRIIKNMNGQLRLKSEEEKGSRFVIVFPFDLPESEITQERLSSPEGTPTPQHTPLPGAEERTLVAAGPSRIDSESGKSARKLKRSTSGESANDSLKSINSGSSNRSHRSDVDRLIEAIQEPHLVDLESRAGSTSRPPLVKRPSQDGGHVLKKLSSRDIMADNDRSRLSSSPGAESLPFSGTPVKAVKVPDPMTPYPDRNPNTGILGEVLEADRRIGGPSELSPVPQSPANMRVLVAEDDPINSRIIMKRLEKLGHTVSLTVNGQECSTAFGDQPGDYDVILMDMQVSKPRTLYIVPSALHNLSLNFYLLGF